MSTAMSTTTTTTNTIDEYSLGDYNSFRISNNAPIWWGSFFAGYRFRLK